MPDKLGRIQKGERLSPKTEFKKGEHWRDPKPFREKEWLIEEYVNKQRSSGEIATQFGVTDAAIIFWLRKHNIPRRTMSQVRSIKHWGSEGETNPMFGKRGASNPHWRGGLTPDRQNLYSQSDWKKIAKEVRRRDKRTCRRCGKFVQRGIHIHHVVSFEVEELRTDIDNLICLCPDCHHWVHSKENTEHEFIGELPG